MLRLLPEISSLLISLLSVHSPAFVPKPLPFFVFFSSLCWLWLTPNPVLARRIKKVSLLDAGSRVECPWNINRLKKNQKNMTCGMMTCKMNDLEIE